MERIRVLLVEDNPGDARLVKEMLAEEQGAFFDLEWADTLDKGLKRLAVGGIQAVLLDLNLPDSKGFNTITRAQSEAPNVPIVVMTGMDDEMLAIRAVRQGIQDYLVKGQVDSRQLARIVRYAIARRLGEERRFTPRELAQYDGKEGRPAYIAFQGKVYDVSASRLWKGGLHSRKHSAGSDLTQMLTGAPHGVDALMKVHVVGDLVKEPTLTQRLLERLVRLHPHPITVHFTIGYAVTVPLFSLLFMLTGNASFELASFYLLLLGFLAAVPAVAFGVLSWRINYGGKLSKIFLAKMVATAVFAVVIAVSLAWRAASPEVLVTGDAASYGYLALVISLIPIATVLGHYGGRIVYG